MEFDRLLRRRRMVRLFEPGRSVPPRLTERLVAAALRAPSAGFSQGLHLLVLDEESTRSAYWAATTDPERAADGWLHGLRSAPLLIVVFSERAAYERRYAREDKLADDYAPRVLEQRWPVAYWDIDAGMAAELILLTAVDAELGACWFGVPTDRVTDLRRTFEVPDGFTPVGVVAVGYPDPSQPVRAPTIARRPRPEMVSYGRFGAMSSEG